MYSRGIATLATLATLGADLLKNLRWDLRWMVSYHPISSTLCLFSKFNLGVAKVAKVAMSQKSHKVRVERSGATLGRRRVVNLTRPHGEDHTSSRVRAPKWGFEPELCK